jgi:hypothetical protein
MRSFIDLTDRFPLKIDLPALQAELARMEAANWVGHYDTTQPRTWTTVPLRAINGSASGPDSVRHGDWNLYRNTSQVEGYPVMASIIDAFKCPVGRVRLSRMSARTHINAHRDIEDEVASVAFRQVRLHIPITTNEGVVFSVGNEKLQMKAGRLYYADFAKVHSVRNDGDQDRVHLFLELKMNPWLDDLFPKFTMLEKIDMALQRVYLPIFWKAYNFWLFSPAVRWAKKSFEGSVLQRLWRALRGRRQPVAG